jgi:hypothetical protein
MDEAIPQPVVGEEVGGRMPEQLLDLRADPAQVPASSKTEM